MKTWRPIVERISKALEFANIDSLRELETLLDGREAKIAVVPRLSWRRTGHSAATRCTLRHGTTLDLSGTR